MSDGEGPDNAPGDDELLPSALTDAWAQLLDNWDDQDAHRRFVALCQTLGALAYAGGQYRSVCEQRDEREPMARRQIDAVVAAAALELMNFKTPSETRRNPLPLIIALIVSSSFVVYTLASVFASR